MLEMATSKFRALFIPEHGEAIFGEVFIFIVLSIRLKVRQQFFANVEQIRACSTNPLIMEPS